MNHYVICPQHYTQSEHTLISDWVNESCSKPVYHHSGGWEPGMVNHIVEHMECEEESDAIAFILKFGGRYSATRPHVIDYKLKD